MIRLTNRAAQAKNHSSNPSHGVPAARCSDVASPAVTPDDSLMRSASLAHPRRRKFAAGSPDPHRPGMIHPHEGTARRSAPVHRRERLLLPVHRARCGRSPPGTCPNLCGLPIQLSTRRLESTSAVAPANRLRPPKVFGSADTAHLCPDSPLEAEPCFRLLENYIAPSRPANRTLGRGLRSARSVSAWPLAGRAAALSAKEWESAMGTAEPGDAAHGPLHPPRSHRIVLTANQSRVRLISAEPANNPATRNIIRADPPDVRVCAAGAGSRAEEASSSAPLSTCACFAPKPASPSSVARRLPDCGATRVWPLPPFRQCDAGPRAARPCGPLARHSSCRATRERLGG